MKEVGVHLSLSVSPITYTCSCPPLPEPPPPPKPPRDHALPPRTNSRSSSTDDFISSRKRPRYEESSGGYPGQHLGHGYHDQQPGPSYPKQRAWDDHRSSEHHRSKGGRHYFHAHPYWDESHW